MKSLIKTAAKVAEISNKSTNGNKTEKESIQHVKKNRRVCKVKL